MSPLLRQPEVPAERPWWLAGAGGFEPRHRCGHAGQRKGVAHMLTATTTTADSPTRLRDEYRGRQRLSCSQHRLIMSTGIYQPSAESAFRPAALILIRPT